MSVFNKEQKLKIEKKYSFTLSFAQSTKCLYFAFFLGKNEISFPEISHMDITEYLKSKIFKNLSTKYGSLSNGISKFLRHCFIQYKVSFFLQREKASKLFLKG